MTTAARKLPGGFGYLGAAMLGFVVTAGFVLANLMSNGHRAFNTTNDGIFWGLPIVVYDFFLLSSTGLALVACLGLVAGIKDFMPLVKRCLWLALAALAGGGATLFLELGAPFKAMYAIPLSFQTASPLFWKVLFVVVFAISLLLLLAKSLTATAEQLAEGAVPKVLAFTALGVTLIAGAVFGMMGMRPFWFGGELPVVFLVESFLGAMSFGIFFTYLVYGFSADRLPAGVRKLFDGKMSGLFAIVIALHAAFVLARVSTGLWSNLDGLQVWKVISGSALFQVEIWLCILLPLVLMLRESTRRQASMQILASALTLVGLFIGRYEFIIGGQMVAPFKGSWTHGLLSYTPSMVEWAMLVMAMCLANAIYAFAESRYSMDD